MGIPPSAAAVDTLMCADNWCVVSRGLKMQPWNRRQNVETRLLRSFCLVGDFVSPDLKNHVIIKLPQFNDASATPWVSTSCVISKSVCAWTSVQRSCATGCKTFQTFLNEFYESLYGNAASLHLQTCISKQRMKILHKIISAGITVSNIVFCFLCTLSTQICCIYVCTWIYCQYIHTTTVDWQGLQVYTIVLSEHKHIHIRHHLAVIVLKL